jgi:hypothetical protein
MLSIAFKQHLEEFLGALFLVDGYQRLLSSHSIFWHFSYCSDSLMVILSVAQTTPISAKHRRSSIIPRTKRHLCSAKCRAPWPRFQSSHHKRLSAFLSNFKHSRAAISYWPSKPGKLYSYLVPSPIRIHDHIFIR